MKRKSKPLITGGLLGLAGLGLLPRGAEANTDIPPVVPDPSLGAALAEDPHLVVIPEPSAQTTAPQTDNQGAGQPAWTPESDQPVMAAAAAAAAEPVGITPPQPQVSAPKPVASKPVAPELVVPELTASEPTGSEIVAPERLGSNRAEADLDASNLDAPDSTAAVPTPEPVEPDLTPAVAPSPSGRELIELPSTPPDSQPGAATQQPEPAATAVTSHEMGAIASPPAPAEPPKSAAASALTAGPVETTAPIAIAPAPALAPVRPTRPVAPAPTARPVSRQTAPDLATLRSRVATVQALLADLRSVYGIESLLAAVDSTATPATTRPVSRPETLRGPQLPPLPSRAQPQKTVAFRPGAVSGASRGQPLAISRSPQLSAGSGKTPNVALALPTPEPVLSSGRAARLAPSVEVAAARPSTTAPPAAATAQAAPSTPAADQVRDDLRIEPLTTAADPAQTFPPSPNAGIPSAFGAEWGDVFFSASLAGADRLRPEADGSLSMGFGLGDARRAIGVELAYNLQSIRQFGENGGFDAKVHRDVYSSDDTQVAAAVGINNFVSYGSDAAGTTSSVYGVVTAAHLLQPDHPVNRLPITATLGAGSGYFSGENTDVGVIAGVGLQVHPQFSINTAWSGVGLNVGASIVPEPTLPLTLNLLYGDIGNNTPAGSVAVLSIGYGFNFGPSF